MGANEQQLEAINSDDRTILCLAGAGAGKSFTLVNRIARLVNRGEDPKSILALTFTNAAAFEMGEKYKKLCTSAANKGQPEFRTFHGFCYSLLIKDKNVRERLGYSKVPEICDDNKIKKLKSEAKLMTNCKLTEAKIEEQVPLTKQEKFSLDTYKKALKKLIKDNNVITFDMLCYNVCELFEKDDECVSRYKKRYKYIFVDEFQDTDRRQLKFIASFSDQTSVFCVGDALQCIYQFRGTSNEYIKAFSADPNWKVIRLFKNYRSTRQICEFANRISKSYADPNYRIEMEGQRDGDDVQVIPGSRTSFNTPVDEGHLRSLIINLKKNDRESAILCRTNKEVNYICDELTREGIQFSRSNKSTDVLDILNSSLDNQYMLEWLSTFLDGKEYSDYIRLAAQQENPDIRWFLSTYGNHTKVNETGKKIIEIRKIMQEPISANDKFNKVTKLLKIKSRCEFNKDVEYTNRQLVESIRDQIEDQEENKIYVGTIHSSKGLEYDTVYLMGVDDKMFELGTEEMNNLYYVGVTRAKNHLVVYRY